MSEAKITSKGRVTIPAEIRKSRRLTEGERVVFKVFNDGTTAICAKSRPLVEHKGTLKNIGAAERSPSDIDVAQLLHQKDYVVLSIERVKKKSNKVSFGRVKLDDLVIFSRQLATMIDSGIPLVQALGILGDQVENKALGAVVIAMRQDIEGGMSLFDALGKHPTVFSDFFINMARAGEASGMLDEVLDRVATYLEKTSALNRKIKSSLVYPAVVIVMAIAITAVLLLKVVPTFAGIFEILGGQLPLPTRILIGLSNILRLYWCS